MEIQYHSWKDEPFIRDLDQSFKVKEILGIIHKYLEYRNISQTTEQKQNLVEFLIEDLKALPFIKPITITWSLLYFTDPTHNNVAPAVMIDIIKKGYKSESHKMILKTWDEDQEKNRIPEITEAQKQELNDRALKDGWDRAVQAVEELRVNIDDWYWRQAYIYLHKMLEYVPPQDLIDRFNAQAEDDIKKEYERIQSGDVVTKDERAITARHISELTRKSIEDPNLQNKINLLRRKLICLDYLVKAKSIKINEEMKAKQTETVDHGS